MISLCVAVCFTTAVIFFVFGFLAGVEVVKADDRNVLRSLDNKQDCDRMNAGRRGYVIISRNDEGFANEMYFLDNENAALAKNVLRINDNGIGFSETGINGPYKH